MEDYGNFVPRALKISMDASLKHLGTHMEMFKYEEYGTFGFPNVLAGSHVVVNGEAFNTYLRDQFNLTKQTYLMKEVVSESKVIIDDL